MSSIDELVQQLDTVLGFQFEPEWHCNGEQTSFDNDDGIAIPDNDEEGIAELFGDPAKTSSSE